MLSILCIPCINCFLLLSLPFVFSFSLVVLFLARVVGVCRPSVLGLGLILVMGQHPLFLLPICGASEGKLSPNEIVLLFEKIHLIFQKQE